MTNSITVVTQQNTITPDIIKQAEILARKTARYQGMTETVAIATYLKGWEIGFKMTTCPEFIQVIQGRPTLSPRGHLALLHNSGIFNGDGYLKAKDFTDDNGVLACTVSMKRGDSNVEYECTVTMEDAKNAGLIKGDSGWKKWPANMLRWRATGFCADFVAPDIGGGMKRANEFGADITQAGDVISGSWEDLDDNCMTLADLLTKYNQDQILAANEAITGKKGIPNPDNIEAVFEHLKLSHNKIEDSND